LGSPEHPINEQWFVDKMQDWQPMYNLYANALPQGFKRKEWTDDDYFYRIRKDVTDEICVNRGVAPQSNVGPVKKSRRG
jgi:hypothetical protein